MITFPLVVKAIYSIEKLIKCAIVQLLGRNAFKSLFYGNINASCTAHIEHTGNIAGFVNYHIEGFKRVVVAVENTVVNKLLFFESETFFHGFMIGV